MCLAKQGERQPALFAALTQAARYTGTERHQCNKYLSPIYASDANKEQFKRHGCGTLCQIVSTLYKVVPKCVTTIELPKDTLYLRTLCDLSDLNLHES